MESRPATVVLVAVLGAAAYFGSTAVTAAQLSANLQDVVKDVDQARVVVGFHSLSSDKTGSRLGQEVGDYVAQHDFQPIG
jgi:hypothetical protein